jgi:hypothetical protein
MHVEGKIHQGFLIFRHELARLKQRKVKLQEVLKNEFEKGIGKKDSK